jgi:hypothetical protein
MNLCWLFCNDAAANKNVRRCFSSRAARTTADYALAWAAEHAGSDG